MIDGFARTVGRAAAAGRIVVRTVAPLDTNPVPGDWRHVTKVDPEPEKRLPLMYPLYLRHTDAVSVGGSRDVTAGTAESTFELLSYVPTPAFHEPSAPEHVTDTTREQAEFLAIPEVLNGDVESLVGTLGAGIEYVRDDLAPAMIDRKLPWLPAGLRRPLSEFAASWLLTEAAFEAYVIQNPDSAAAREAGVTAADTLDAPEAARRAVAAERRLGSEVVYVEYSGTYGGDEAARLLSAVDRGTNWSRVWYGGGIDSREDAVRMHEAGADAVVVGDAFHEVATEEARLCERALAELESGADHGTVHEWVRETVDVEDSRAARYLSTVPAVEEPTARADQYLAAGVYARLAIERLALGADDPSPADLHDLVADRGVPGEGSLAPLGEQGRAYATDSAVGVLGSRLGIDAGTLPVDHLGVVARPGEE